MFEEIVFFDTLRQGLWIAVMIAAPMLAVALVAGVSIGLFQALTSVQEMTLTFVPKVGAMLIVFWVSMSFMSICRRWHASWNLGESGSNLSRRIYLISEIGCRKSLMLRRSLWGESDENASAPASSRLRVVKGLKFSKSVSVLSAAG